MDVQLLLREAGNFDTNQQCFLGLIEFQIDWTEHFGLRLKPVLQLAGEEPRRGTEQFERPARDQVKELLHRRGEVLELLKWNRLEPLGLDD